MRRGFHLWRGSSTRGSLLTSLALFMGIIAVVMINLQLRNHYGTTFGTRTPFSKRMYALYPWLVGKSNPMNQALIKTFFNSESYPPESYNIEGESCGVGSSTLETYVRNAPSKSGIAKHKTRSIMTSCVPIKDIGQDEQMRTVLSGCEAIAPKQPAVNVTDYLALKKRCEELERALVVGKRDMRVLIQDQLDSDAFEHIRCGYRSPNHLAHTQNFADFIKPHVRTRNGLSEEVSSPSMMKGIMESNPPSLPPHESKQDDDFCEDDESDCNTEQFSKEQTHKDDLGVIPVKKLYKYVGPEGKRVPESCGRTPFPYAELYMKEGESEPADRLKNGCGEHASDDGKMASKPAPIKRVRNYMKKEKSSPGKRLRPSVSASSTSQDALEERSEFERLEQNPVPSPLAQSHGASAELASSFYGSPNLAAAAAAAPQVASMMEAANKQTPSAGHTPFPRKFPRSSSFAHHEIRNSRPGAAVLSKVAGAFQQQQQQRQSALTIEPMIEEAGKQQQLQQSSPSAGHTPFPSKHRARPAIHRGPAIPDFPPPGSSGAELNTMAAALSQASRTGLAVQHSLSSLSPSSSLANGHHHRQPSDTHFNPNSRGHHLYGMEGMDSPLQHHHHHQQQQQQLTPQPQSQSYTPQNEEMETGQKADGGASTSLSLPMFDFIKGDDAVGAVYSKQHLGDAMIEEKPRRKTDTNFLDKINQKAWESAQPARNLLDKISFRIGDFCESFKRRRRPEYRRDRPSMPHCLRPLRTSFQR
eukprot:jgi/Bigna1/75519/fgenesh1_pg.35_\